MWNTDPFLAELLAKVQNDLGPDRREEIAEMLARNRNRQVRGGMTSADGEPGLARLAADGHLALGEVLDRAAVLRLVEHFKARKVYAAHVPVYSDGKARSVAATRRLSDYGSYRLADVLSAPGVLDLALRPDILGLATAYLGALPYLYSAHAWWTYADRPEPARTHRVHRDQDDFRFLSLFVYLTEVRDEADGPTVYYTGSHRKASLANRSTAAADPVLRAEADRIGRIDAFFPPRSANATRLDQELRSLLAPTATVFLGPAGSAFIADTFGLHRGTMPRGRDRLAVWLRYGLYRNWAYRTDRTRPVALPADLRRRLSPLDRKVLELLLKEPGGAARPAGRRAQ